MKNFTLYRFLSVSLFITSQMLFVNVSIGQSTSINSNGTGMVIQNDNTNTPVPSSALIEMRSANKGLLLPRMTTTQIQQVQNPTVGLAIYDTDAKCLKTYNGSTWECASGTSSTSVSSPMTTSLASKVMGTDNNYGRGIAIDNSGNYYVAGHFEGQIKFTTQDGFTTSQGGKDGFIAKFNAAGVLLWKVFMSSTNNESIEDLEIDVNGNVYVVGYCSNQMTVYPSSGNAQTVNAPYYGVFVLKLTTNGGWGWCQPFSAYKINDLALDGSGNPHIAGSFLGTITIGGTTLTSVSSSYDAYVAKLNTSSNGNVIWAFAEGGSQSDGAGGLAVDNSGNVFVTGWYDGTADFGASPSVQSLTARGSIGYSDIFLAKYNSSGGLAWVRTAGGNSADEGRRIAVNTAGTEVYLVGEFYGTILFGTGLGTNALTSAGSTDIVIAKYDGSGNILFSTKAGGGYNDIPNAIVLTSSNNFYLTGKIGNQNCTFSSNNNPSPVQPFSLNNPCSADACFLAKYNSSGVLQIAISTTNNYAVEGFGIAHNAGKTWITGDFSNQANFGFQQLVASYSPELFIWQFSEN